MNLNKGFFIGLASGVAAAGLVGTLFSTTRTDRRVGDAVKAETELAKAAADVAKAAAKVATEHKDDKA